MIFQLFCISLCILAPLRTVLGGNYYKSFAHSVLESLPDSVKPQFKPVFSQIVQTCAQFESDRFENPESADHHFYFGQLPLPAKSQLTPGLPGSIQTSVDSLVFYYTIKNQKKIIWFTAQILHFCSETAIPHRIYRDLPESAFPDELVLQEDEKLDSRNSVFIIPTLQYGGDPDSTSTIDLINYSLVQNRSVAEKLFAEISTGNENKRHSSDRHHKNGNKVMVSLYEEHQDSVQKMITVSQNLALDLVVSVITGNQKLKINDK